MRKTTTGKILQHFECSHIEAKTKWPPILWRHFQMHFSEWEYVNFNYDFTEVCSQYGPINNIPALFQIMAWRRPGNKPLSEPIMVSLLTHICITRLQWVNKEIKSVISTWCWCQECNGYISSWRLICIGKLHRIPDSQSITEFVTNGRPAELITDEMYMHESDVLEIYKLDKFPLISSVCICSLERSGSGARGN